MLIYSIGHSNRDLSQFISVLKKYRIKLVIDVRRFPTSKFDRFKKENLERILRENNIEYKHLPSLGGYRGGYQKYMTTREWKNSYLRLKEFATQLTTVFMCAERYPFRCHRRQIAKRLKSEGWRVIHILNDKTWEEK